jgi:hypothetical protein
MAFVLAVVVAPNAALSEDEGLIADASTLGYRAGAMSYCKDHHAGDDEAKYNLLAIRALKDLDKLSSEDKRKALVVKRSVEKKGEHLGKKLDRDRCESIRKLYGTGALLGGKD